MRRKLPIILLLLLCVSTVCCFCACSGMQQRHIVSQKVIDKSFEQGYTYYRTHQVTTSISRAETIQVPDKYYLIIRTVYSDRTCITKKVEVTKQVYETTTIDTEEANNA